MSKILNVAGDVDVITIDIGTNKGWTSIRGLYSSVELYEDIYSPSIHGNVTLIDTQGFFNSANLVGNEWIRIELKTPTMAEKYTIKQIFIVHKIANRTIVDPHKQIYTLYFSTPETVVDAGMKISRKFSGTADGVISNILKTFLKTNKKLVSTKADNNISMVSPFYSPFQIINYYAANAVRGKNYTPNYLFYETNKSYVFSSLDILFAEKSTCDYYYDMDPNRRAAANGSQRSIEEEFKTALNIRFSDHFNEFDRIDSGFHRSKTYVHDIVTKQTKAVEYTYVGSFKKDIKHLGANPMIADLSPTHRIVTHQNTNNRVHDSMFVDHSGYAVNMRTPLLYDLEFLKLELEVHGRTDLEVGNIINFKLGQYKQLAKSQLNNPQDIDDQYYNGRYIVTAIRHQFIENQHRMVLQLAKNASEKDITK